MYRRLKMLICIILVALACTASPIVVNYNTNHILEYVRRRNYPIEVHNVKTTDGYELNIHRIPYGLNNNSFTGNRSVILLVHGLQESAEHWMINGNKSLAFLLANLGYDVWMTNARGTYHSRGHTKYDISNPEYWDFSWHEIGLYDHPATIDYILSKTGVSKLSYIGHSQGTTSFLVLTSIYPEYNDKIKIMVGLAPAAYMAHVKNPVFVAMSRVWELINPKQGLLDNVFLNTLSEHLCKLGIIGQSICSNILFIMAGYDYEQLDQNLIPDIWRSLPAGASTKQWIHYLQLVRSGYFRQYEYQGIENVLRYGRIDPPIYDLNKVTAKIALYYSQNDWLAQPQDVRRLRDELPNVVVDHLVIYEGFNHWDFLFAKDVMELLYNNVIETLSKYNE